MCLLTKNITGCKDDVLISCHSCERPEFGTGLLFQFPLGRWNTIYWIFKKSIQLLLHRCNFSHPKTHGNILNLVSTGPSANIVSTFGKQALYFSIVLLSFCILWVMSVLICGLVSQQPTMKLKWTPIETGIICYCMVIAGQQTVAPALFSS